MDKTTSITAAASLTRQLIGMAH